jgi:hypothetical protein
MMIVLKKCLIIIINVLCVEGFYKNKRNGFCFLGCGNGGSCCCGILST